MVGKRFGPYELEELLGRGGMGEVHRAVDTRKSRPVALKLLPASLTGDSEVEARFRREAEVAARLTDPHVIPIHDFGELHGRLFLDMRLVNGVDLAKTLQADGALLPARAVSILTQVAGALDAAHDSGLVHRDVKPSNILLSTPRPGAEDFVYLIDFGIAAGSMIGTRLTATGQTVGTAAYMAPERFVEGRDSDPRVDVYALGCVLHEMLTGSVAFEGTSFPNLMYQHLNSPPPRPSRSDGLGAAFDQVIATALAKNPDERYRRAGDLADAARSALESSTRPREDAPPAPVSAPPRPQSAVPTRFGPPITPSRAGPQASPAAWAPSARGSTSAVSAAPGGSSSHHPWRLAGAIAALVVHALSGVVTVSGTAITFSHCSGATSACVGGTIGLLAVASTVVGLVAAVLALTRRRRNFTRYLVATWVLFGAALILVLVTAGFDAAATG